MFRILAAIVVFASGSAAAAEQADYKGPFPTTALYEMCARPEPAQRDKCEAYLQGLIYGLRIQKQMTDKGMAVCLPETTPAQARPRVTGFIDSVTEGRPANNRDGGDWIAFMALAQGNLCGKAKR